MPLTQRGTRGAVSPAFFFTSLCRSRAHVYRRSRWGVCGYCAAAECPSRGTGPSLLTLLVCEPGGQCLPAFSPFWFVFSVLSFSA